VYNRTRELIAQKNYSAAMYTILNAYGFESFQANKMFGLEEMAIELEANEEGQGITSPEDEFSEEIDIEEELAVDDTVDIEPTPDDAINIMDLLGLYQNTYTDHLVKFIKKNPKVIDMTGDISNDSNEMFNEFAEKSLIPLQAVYKNLPELKIIEDLRSLLKLKSKMTAIKGTPNAPFIYEGIQVLYYTLIQTSLALIPASINNKTSLGGVVNENGLTVVAKLFDIAKDINAMADKLGTSIVFEEPILNEVTGNNVKLENTIYEKSDILKKSDESKDGIFYAGESINNLLEIKNNKALPEFSILLKGLTISVGLSSGLEFQKSTADALNRIVDLLNNPSEAESKNAELMDYFATNIINTQIKKYGELVASEKTRAMKSGTEEPLMDEAGDTTNMDNTEAFSDNTVDQEIDNEPEFNDVPTMDNALEEGTIEEEVIEEETEE